VLTSGGWVPVRVLEVTLADLNLPAHIPYETAAAMHRKQWFEGKHSGQSPRQYSPPLREEGTDDSYVLAEIPVGRLNFVYANPDRVEKYIGILREQGTMGPSWGKFNGRSGKVFLFDGNHRAAAAAALEYPTVPVMMPYVDYLRYLGA
jgi:hypothetical protein